MKFNTKLFVMCAISALALASLDIKPAYATGKSKADGHETSGGKKGDDHERGQGPDRDGDGGGRGDHDEGGDDKDEGGDDDHDEGGDDKDEGGDDDHDEGGDDTPDDGGETPGDDGDDTPDGDGDRPNGGDTDRPARAENRESNSDKVCYRAGQRDADIASSLTGTDIDGQYVVVRGDRVVGLVALNALNPGQSYWVHKAEETKGETACVRRVKIHVKQPAAPTNGPKSNIQFEGHVVNMN